MGTVTSLSFPVTESSFHAVINASVIIECWCPGTLCNVYGNRCICPTVECAHFVHGSGKLMKTVLWGPVNYSSCCREFRRMKGVGFEFLAPRIEFRTFAFEMTWIVQGLGRISEALRPKEWVGTMGETDRFPQVEIKGRLSMQPTGGQGPELVRACNQDPLFLC